MFLTEPQVASLIRAGNTYLRCHAALRRFAEDKTAWRMFWAIKPKTHKWQCTCLRRLEAGSRLNPRFMGTFSDEAFIGPITSLAKRCHESSVQEATLLKWQMIVLARWGLLP